MATASPLTAIRGRQIEVSHLLMLGVISSLVWMGGLGSAFAIYCAIKARRIINNSDEHLYGTCRVWWCLCYGGAGLIVWAPVLLGIILQLFVG